MSKKILGRPQKELDWGKLDAVLQFGARLLDCQGILDLSDETILKKIKQKYGVSFAEYRELRMSTMRAKLLQKQFDVAMQGNVTMLIWLGKQHLGQVDKLETENVTASIQVTIDADDSKF
jgi:hypothetical protein